MKKTILAFIISTLAAFAQNTISVTIGSGQSLSPAVELKPQGRAGFCTAAALVMPSAWTAADITFQASVDGQTFGDLFDDAGSEVVVKAAAGRVIAMASAYFWGIRWVRIRSGTSAAPVAQGASRTLTILCRE
ncbi:MAG: hypothetical protein ACP5QB_10130 [Thiomonas sp.]